MGGSWLSAAQAAAAVASANIPRVLTGNCTEKQSQSSHNSALSVENEKSLSTSVRWWWWSAGASGKSKGFPICFGTVAGTISAFARNYRVRLSDKTNHEIAPANGHHLLSSTE